MYRGVDVVDGGCDFATWVRPGSGIDLGQFVRNRKSKHEPYGLRENRMKMHAERKRKERKRKEEKGTETANKRATKTQRHVCSLKGRHTLFLSGDVPAV